MVVEKEATNLEKRKSPPLSETTELLEKATKNSWMAPPCLLTPSISDWARACQQKVAYLYSELDSEQLKSNEEFLVSLHLLQTHYKIFDPISVAFNGTTKQEYIYPCSGSSDNCLKYCARWYKLYLTNFTKW
jgi:hypothetical protein